MLIIGQNDHGKRQLEQAEKPKEKKDINYYFFTIQKPPPQPLLIKKKKILLFYMWFQLQCQCLISFQTNFNVRQRNVDSC